MQATVPAIAERASKAEIVLKADAKARVATTEVTIRGSATVAGKTVTRTAALPTDPRDPPIEQVAIAVAVPTPFKFTASLRSGVHAARLRSGAALPAGAKRL